MKCSVVIRTFNESRYIRQIMEAIESQSVPASSREVVIVDSGSTDSTLDVVSSFGTRIEHIKQSEFSYGRSLNIGCAASRGEWLVFLSGHCVPTNEKWLENLLSLHSNRETGYVYGRQVGGGETKFSEHQLFDRYFPPDHRERPNPFFCNNANAAIRASVWRDHQFDETLTGLEDMHLGKRLVAAGNTVEYVPEASVYHYHHETWKQVRLRYEREAIALQRIMPEVHISALDALRYFIAGSLTDFSRAITSKTLLRYFPEIVCFRACQYFGAWKGNHEHRKLSQDAKEKYFYPRRR